ncbi:hypothetical protein QCA50_001534 [Cerrena zonata]|uniref:DNA replication licensing factor MCM5 n=1 Tax=Cerrena zonata TaxID=2478898 RepID=A0AAW0GR86_9APHY
MSGFDANRVYSVAVHDAREPTAPDLPSETEKHLLEFILAYRVGSDFPYRDQLRGNLLMKQHHLEVDLRHVSLYNDELAHAIQEKPSEILALFENAATRAARTILFPLAHGSEAGIEAAALSIPNVQVMIKSGLNLQHFRELTATMTNKLVRIPGIVISASVLSSRATKLHLQCRACRSIKILHPPSGLGGMGSGGSSSGLPRVCDAPSVPGQEKDCPMDPYLIIHSKSSFTDHQVLKLQEAPDMVPIGDLPRHIPLSADRFLAGQIVPGTRVIATGVYSTYQSAKTKSSGSTSTLRNTYIRLVHLEVSSSSSSSGGLNPFGVQFSPEEEEEFGHMARSEGFYERFARSVGPSIYGSLDIKKAITCLLFGGSKKILPDGMRLRGDINVLLLGDPWYRQKSAAQIRGKGRTNRCVYVWQRLKCCWSNCLSTARYRIARILSRRWCDGSLPILA